MGVFKNQFKNKTERNFFLVKYASGRKQFLRLKHKLFLFSTFFLHILYKMVKWLLNKFYFEIICLRKFLFNYCSSTATFFFSEKYSSQLSFWINQNVTFKTQCFAQTYYDEIYDDLVKKLKILIFLTSIDIVSILNTSTILGYIWVLTTNHVIRKIALNVLNQWLPTCDVQKPRRWYAKTFFLWTKKERF